MIDAVVLGRHWYDAALIFLLGGSFLTEAVKIKARGGLGSVMRTKAATLGVLFLYALFFLPPPAPPIPLALTAQTGVAVVLRMMLFYLLVREMWELMVRGWVVRDD